MSKNKAEHLVVLGLVSIALTVLIGFLVTTHFSPFSSIDTYLNRVLTLSEGSPLIGLYSAISTLADFWIIISLLAIISVFFAFKSRIKESLVWIISIGTAGLLSETLKYFFLFDRPLQNITDALGPSYPSGHTTAAFALAGLIIFSFALRRRAPLKLVIICLALCIAFAVALSRLALGAHWLSDIVGGFLLGTGVVCTAVGLSELFVHKKK